MKRIKLRKIYNSKIFWAVISLLCSFVMWAYISNPTASDYVQVFRGVQVEFEGQDTLLTERNLSISSVDNQSVTVTLKGDRNKIGKLNASDIKAVIDVSGVKQPNDMTWAYVVRFPDNFDSSGISVINKSPETINFTVVRNATKTVSVKGSFDGKIADGCIAEEYVFEPSTIVIEGPEEKINLIDHAWLNFGSGEIDSTYSEEVGFTLRDASGIAVSTTGLKLSASSVTATQPILKSKEIPLTVNLIPGGGITEADCTVTIEPKTINVAGESRLIDGLNSIELGTVDLASFQNVYTKAFTITLEDDVQNLTGINEAEIKIEVKGAFAKTFTTDNISCTNVTFGYSANIDTKVLELTLRSKSEETLNAIRPEDLSVVVDLSDFGATTGQVIANGTVIINQYDNVGAVGDVRVSVTLTKD